jgi:hypothetical protein
MGIILFVHNELKRVENVWRWEVEGCQWRLLKTISDLLDEQADKTGSIHR